MFITVEEIRAQLNEIWPDLQQIWCFDQEYICPTLKELTPFVNDFRIDNIKAENPDCDDFALQLHAEVKRFANWSFGEVFANKVHSWSVLHNLNICVCQEGIVLIDPKKKTIWQANSDNDNILWVRI